MKSDEIPQEGWELIKAHLGYNDEELALFKENPRNVKVLATAMTMKQKTFVFEVIKSKGCNSGHVVGTRFFFSGDGNLITRMAPKKVCAFTLPVMSNLVFTMQELLYAGVDPNEMCFTRSGCFDVGVSCGGWGNIIVEAKTMDREEAMKLHRG